MIAAIRGLACLSRRCVRPAQPMKGLLMIISPKNNRQRRASNENIRQHLFQVGEHVQMAGRLSHQPTRYTVTGRLPERNDALQYRVRNGAEAFDRVVSELDLSADVTPTEPSSAALHAGLIERTFQYA